MDSQVGQDGFRVLSRLRSVKWDGDWDDAYAHVLSRQLLMREYLRRSALWAKVYSAEKVWPFFDITNYAAPKLQLPQDLSQELDEFLRSRLIGAVKTTCAGAVRLAELKAHDSAAETAGLPDLYEPLLVMYERGGDFMRDNSGALDLTGVSFRAGTMQDYLGDTPIVTVDASVLDALDTEGRVMFFATATDQGPILRRRLPPGGGEQDEVLNERLVWEPTDRLRTLEEETERARYVQITISEAARLIEAVAPGGSAAAHGD
ncbi:hypothetical protein [Streptomyces cyaneofuscatus]|uniref:hypothetical protein n=1 Tax=Streptomyces cyaneofuscatus TaxID=66883 RepID=UPI0034485197